MSEENILTIAHQDGPQSLRLKKGGYCIKNGRIAISIDTENVDPDGWPPVALFCIHNHPIDNDLRAGDIFECNGGMWAEDADGEEATNANANAYFTFHAEEVYVKFSVKQVRSDAVVFDFQAKHEDTDYYNERAKKCPTAGRFILKPTQFRHFWIPI